MSARFTRRSRVRPIHIVVALIFALSLLPFVAPTVSRAADTPIYGDSLAGSWANWSWNTSTNMAAGSPARGSSAIAVTYDAAWGGLYLHSNSPIAATGSSTLRFWLHGGSAGNQRIKVMVRDTADRASGFADIVAQAGSWQQVEIPMSQLGFSGNIAGVVLQDNSGGRQPTFYVDDLILVGAGLSAQPNLTRKIYLPVIAGRGQANLGGDTPPAPTPAPPTNPTPVPPTNPTPPANPIAGTVRVMPLGDSITEGPSGGYRNGLWNRLTADGFAIDYVGPRYDQWTKVPDKDHAGTPGFTTGGIIDNIDGWMDGYKPQVVLLLIGTNDLAWWSTEAPETAAARVGTIIDKIRAKSPGTYIVVGTITPMKGVAPPNNLSRNDLANRYNAAVRQQVADRAGKGTLVSVAEINGAVSLSDLYDDVHPNSAGHEKMAEVWFNAVKPLLARP